MGSSLLSPQHKLNAITANFFAFIQKSKSNRIVVPDWIFLVRYGIIFYSNSTFTKGTICKTECFDLFLAIYLLIFVLSFNYNRLLDLRCLSLDESRIATINNRK